MTAAGSMRGGEAEKGKCSILTVVRGRGLTHGRSGAAAGWHWRVMSANVWVPLARPVLRSGPALAEPVAPGGQNGTFLILVVNEVTQVITEPNHRLQRIRSAVRCNRVVRPQKA